MSPLVLDSSHAGSSSRKGRDLSWKGSSPGRVPLLEAFHSWRIFKKLSLSWSSLLATTTNRETYPDTDERCLYTWSSERNWCLYFHESVAHWRHKNTWTWFREADAIHWKAKLTAVTGENIQSSKVLSFKADVFKSDLDLCSPPTTGLPLCVFLYLRFLITRSGINKLQTKVVLNMEHADAFRVMTFEWVFQTTPMFI